MREPNKDLHGKILAFLKAATRRWRICDPTFRRRDWGNVLIEQLIREIGGVIYRGLN
jgi:hypothetical protein